MELKKQLYRFCQAFVENRITRIHVNIKNIQESLSSETKNSAGDKHETGRAMLQLEREKLGQQLMEAEKMAQILSKVQLNNPSEMVALGSFVKTSKANYFIAISAGEYKLSAKSVFCISAKTPIGQLLLGKTMGDIVDFKDAEIKIIEIL